MPNTRQSKTANSPTSGTTQRTVPCVATSAPGGVSNYVVGYGSQYNIHHYSKVENGVISAKHGNGIVVQLPQIDAYFPNSQYGSPVAYFW